MSILNVQSLSHLASLNLDEEGATILQEMVNAITLAIEKCNQLEAIILKNSDKAKPLAAPATPIGKISVVKGLDELPETPKSTLTNVSEKSNEDNLKPPEIESSQPTVPINPEEPAMPKPIVINIKEEKMDEDIQKPEENAPDVQLNISASSSEVDHQGETSADYQIYLSLNKLVSEKEIKEFLLAADIGFTKVYYYARYHYCFCFVNVPDEDSYNKCLKLNMELTIDGFPVMFRPRSSKGIHRFNFHTESPKSKPSDTGFDSGPREKFIYSDSDYFDRSNRYNQRNAQDWPPPSSASTSREFYSDGDDLRHHSYDRRSAYGPHKASPRYSPYRGERGRNIRRLRKPVGRKPCNNQQKRGSKKAPKNCNAKKSNKKSAR